jgi:hypothetical protein
MQNPLPRHADHVRYETSPTLLTEGTWRSTVRNVASWNLTCAPQVLCRTICEQFSQSTGGAWSHLYNRWGGLPCAISHVAAYCSVVLALWAQEH